MVTATLSKEEENPQADLQLCCAIHWPDREVEVIVEEEFEI